MSSISVFSQNKQHEFSLGHGSKTSFQMGWSVQTIWTMVQEKENYVEQ